MFDIKIYQTFPESLYFDKLTSSMSDCFFISTPTFGFHCFFCCCCYFNHSDRYIMILYCGFNLHFPNIYWWSTSFLAIIWHQCILLNKISLYIFVHFLAGVFLVCFSVGIWEFFMYYRYQSFVGYMWFTNIFCQSIVYIHPFFSVK